MLVATLLFALTDALSKWLVESYSIIQIVWIRSIVGLLLFGIYVIVIKKPQQLKTANAGWHLLRGLLSVALLFSLFYGIKHIPLAEYVALIFSVPILAAIFSPWFLNEKVSTYTWSVIGIGFIGILFIARPTPDHFHIAHLVMLGAATAMAMLMITARKLSKTETLASLNFYLYPITIIVCAYGALQSWKAPGLLDWSLFILLGISATTALGCVIQAVRYAKPSIVLPIDYIRIIWIILIGYFIWDEIPDLMTWIGMLIIVSSGFYIVRHNREIPEECNLISEADAYDEIR